MEENAGGKGNTVLFTSAVDLSWSDWPLKGIFVALINRSVHYLYSQNSDELSFMTGDNVEVRLRDVSGGSVTLRNPNGTEMIPKIKQTGQDALLSINGVDQPGSYSLYYQGGLRNMFEVNLPGDLFNFVQISQKKLTESFNGGEVILVERGENIENIILQSKYGMELWKWFIGGVFLLLIFEIILGQRYFRVKN
jgi:hypothetical protein